MAAGSGPGRLLRQSRRGARPPRRQRAAGQGRPAHPPAQRRRHPVRQPVAGRPAALPARRRRTTLPPLRTIARQRLRGVRPRPGQCLGRTPADEQPACARLRRRGRAAAGGAAGVPGLPPAAGILRPAGALPVRRVLRPEPRPASMPRRGAGTGRAVRQARPAPGGHGGRGATGAVLHPGDQPVPAPLRPHPPVRPGQRASRDRRPHPSAGFRGAFAATGERPRQRSGATLPTVLRGARPGALRPRAGLLQRAPRTARAVQQAAAQGPALDLRRQRDLRRPGRRQPGALSPRPAPARHRRAVHQPRPAAVHADRRAQERLHPGGQRAGHAGALPRRTEPAARQPCPRCQRLAADQPAVAELPVAGRARPGRRRPARAAAALRRQRRSGVAIADRGPARGQQQALHAAPADARADRLRPWPGDHPGLRRERVPRHRGVPPRRRVRALPGTLRVDQQLYRDGAAHRRTGRGDEMAGEAGQPSNL